MEMNIRMVINHKLRFSPMVYANLQGYAKFKVDFHQVSIKARKDPSQKWYDLPYLETDDAIDAMLNQWPVDWHFTTDLSMGRSKFATQKKKEEAKLKMTHLAEKRKEEAIDKAQAEREVVQQTGK